MWSRKKETANIIIFLFLKVRLGGHEDHEDTESTETRLIAQLNEFRKSKFSFKALVPGFWEK